MMNRLLAFQFFFFTILSFGLSQQTQVPKNKQYISPVPPAVHPASNLQAPPVGHPIHNDIPAGNRNEEEVIIGTTFFDLQTVGSLGGRLHSNGDEVSATWHFGMNTDAFPDRGTGFNHSDGSSWGPIPTARLEADIRGGYPSFTQLGDGTEAVISHTLDNGVWHLGLYRKAPGSFMWDQSTIPSVVSFGGMVWAKVATGGADGNSLHVIAITLHQDFGGMPYDGLAQHLLYFRSQDGGDSWDITDMKIPGCDSTLYNTIDSECYTIAANGETVAIGVFPSWGDATLYKSSDNGDSWSTTTMLDFPIDKYDGNGYTVDDIPMDPNAPDSLAIFSTDGYASMVIDDNDMAHVVFGNMYYSGINGFFYFPGTDGLSYWNETMGANGAQAVAFTEDFDGSGMIEVQGIAGYFLSLTSMPSIGVHSSGYLFIAYSAFNELYYLEEDGQNYRQIYMIASLDGGASWSSPYAAINEETSADPDLIPFVEGVYPSIPQRISGSTIPLIYQQDFRPGLHVSGDEDIAETNFISYSELGIDNFVMGNTAELTGALEAIEVTPNPTAGLVNITYSLSEKENIVLRVFNLYGQQLAQYDIGIQGVGTHQQSIQLDDFNKGIYMIQIDGETGMMTKRVVKM